ncbi:ferritin-like domain-containing protein [Spirosoma validum]|uniref:Ferritin-like domain-containing protein n=1 Tax=Spirosoma validum TaxID=2771355 RepID=A0A927B5P5_9BACT|nr:ferritin-like domain-containing protein [Spirosoma validum]MBD2756111.1 ferritin-like domain-containing protein [Spirosoma validum]
MEKLPKDLAEISQSLTGKESARLGRRIFMRYLGATAAAGVALSACQNEVMDSATPRGAARAGYRVVDLGDLETNDTAILNYAYALEQLEAAFYSQVIMTPYTGITNSEMIILKDIRDHEIAHRELFKTALGGAAIPGLTPDFTMIDFKSRAAVLGVAKTYENLGVSAYNGAGKFIKNADYLTLAGKIVSVEARHASIIATLIDPMSVAFAGEPEVSNMGGLDKVRSFREVLTAAAPFIYETINFNAR